MLLTPETLRILDALALRTRRSFYGTRQGAHRSQRRGHGVEFSEYRSYEIGDNPRYIDWNLFARSDKVYIKRYLEEENVSVSIMIDGSASMMHPTLQRKWEMTKLVAASTAYIALSCQDPVTISVLGGGHSSQFWSPRALSAVERFFLQEEQRERETSLTTIDIAEETRRAATRLKFPGVCIVISDFLVPLPTVVSMLGHLQAKNLEIHAVQVLHETDIEPSPNELNANLIDSETGVSRGLILDRSTRETYTKLLTEHNDELRRYCLSQKIQFVSGIAKEPLGDSTIATITKMGIFV
jgi:uncharacterized protein (DUF58 family)